MLNKPLVGYDILSQQECQEAIDFCLNYAVTTYGRIGGKLGDQSGEYNKDVRDVTIYTPPEDMSHYEYSRYGFRYRSFIDPIFDANDHYFDFEVDGLPEFHFLKYEVGCHYNLHSDVGMTVERLKSAEKEESMNLDTRKLSFSVFLNEDYEGGDLVFPGIPSEDYKKPNTPCKTGDIIVFPSYFYHEVKPVTSGVRWVGVGWLHGKKPFK